MKTFLRKIVSPYSAVKKREIYSILQGENIGNMIVFIVEEFSKYKFLLLPNMLNIEFEVNEFREMKRKKIVELVEILPNDVYTVCEKQYIKNIATYK